MPDSAQPLAENQQPYRVLARKYRPQTFAELIGQDAMVQTLANAIKRDRLAHAFLMTGVRGVGKTSTARLIAKALNCIGPDGQGGPTIAPCGVCEPCVAIAEGRHIDVIEMDAASHTGVDDVREIIEAVRYAAVSARYKIYIIDEVHMLSKNAFNALLKTLEEPPPHVKFLFATTEVNKVPITVLSRCQRFDLRRITADMLAKHFNEILGKEGVEAEEEAVWLIANAAEGSARDGLSILDQAIAHADLDGHHSITGAQVREMLGLSDRSAIRRLFGLLLDGNNAGLLEAVREQYALGVEPVSLMRGLLDLVHAVTVVKVGRADNPVFGADERSAIADWAQSLGFPSLHRLWQLLLKGHDEVVRAATPIEAAEMALLRVLHAANMPDPGELLALLQQGGSAANEGAGNNVAGNSAAANGVGNNAAGIGAATYSAAANPTPLNATDNNAPAPSSSATTPVSQPASSPASEMVHTGAPPANLPSSVKALVELCWQHNRASMGQALQDKVRPVRIAPPQIDIARGTGLGDNFTRELAETLTAITGTRWTVAFADGEGAPTLFEQEQAAQAAETAAIMDLPIVKAAFAAFPDAKLVPPDMDKRKAN
ncbi:DNA polymerase III subunit gamma/tau [Pseudonocardia sp. TMWB2A]|uniref:DNA polymerase III subunit gamma/tau n=1 Tax=Pseudonocardia sp. TMWB2A TaxID=687430 RepID=UPI00307FC8D9